MSIEKLFSNFCYATFRITIEAIEPIHFSYFHETVIRGSLGNVLRNMVCLFKKQECKTCDIRKKCVYAYLFETIIDNDDPKIKKGLIRSMPEAPHPYIIRIDPNAKPDYEPGETLSFELVLIGKRAIGYLTYFAGAYLAMGRRGIGAGRGKFILKSIETIGKDGESKHLFSPENKTIHMGTIICSGDESKNNLSFINQCTIRFITPLRLLRNRKEVRDIYFAIFFRSLLRSKRDLAAIHCGIENIDWNDIMQPLNEKINTIETVKPDKTKLDESYSRFSYRQKQSMTFRGIVGDVTFIGDLTPFWPFIVLGEKLHIGKNTSFGLGRYRIIEIS